VGNTLIIMSNWNNLNNQQAASHQTDQLDPRIQSAAIDTNGRLVLNVNDNILKWKLPLWMGPNPTLTAELSNSYLHNYEEALRVDKRNSEHGWVSGEHINTSALTIQRLQDDNIRMMIEDPRMPELEMPRSVWKRIEHENPMSPRNCYLTALHEQQVIADAIHAYKVDEKTRPSSVDVKVNAGKVLLSANRADGALREIVHLPKDVYDRLVGRNISPKDIYAMVFQVGLPHAGVSYKSTVESKSLIDGLKSIGQGLAHSASELFDRLTSSNGHQTLNR